MCTILVHVEICVRVEVVGDVHSTPYIRTVAVYCTEDHNAAGTCNLHCYLKQYGYNYWLLLH